MNQPRLGAATLLAVTLATSCRGEVGNTGQPGNPRLDGGDPNAPADPDAGGENPAPSDPLLGDADNGDPGPLPDCADPAVLCVDDDAGQTQEYATLQAAANAVSAGQMILVHAGHYAGFELTTGGSSTARVTVRGLAGAIIDSDGPDGYGVYLENVNYVTVEGLTITGVSARGLAHRGATATAPVVGLEIRNNQVTDAGTEGMYLSQVSQSLIEGNVITNSGTSGAARTHGIYLANAGSDGTTLRGNVISASGTAGIHFNGDLSIGGDGLISDLVVEGNLLFDNGQNGLNMDGVQDSVIRNNLIYGNQSNGLRAYAIDGAAGPRGLVIVNNTIHVPAGAAWCVRLTEDLGDNVVFNNILFNDGSHGSIALDQTAGFASSHNAVVDRFTPDRDTTILSLTAWQGLGYDSGSFLATPATTFINVGAANYHLLTGADAINGGVAAFGGATAPPTDLEGSPRQGAPDLGAFEAP